MSIQLFTVGYEGKDLDEFLDGLEDHGIECLLDVRHLAFSHKRGFSKTVLSTALESRGIQYTHLKKLGSPSAVRKELKSTGDYDKFFREMEAHLATQEESIERAYDYVKQMRCCLMCYEKLATKCHRKVVAEKIQERDKHRIKVKHM